MNSKLHVALVQSNLVWEDIEANLSHHEALIEGIDQTIDLLVLPEMFPTGFSMDTRQVSEEESGRSVSWMKQQSIDLNCTICGSLIIKENQQYFNRFYAVSEGEIMARYDKRHLFRMGAEHETYTPGTNRVVFNVGDWRIAPFICYDVRFPVWIRNRGDYDLALFVANWPAPRDRVWTTLLAARAIENQSYVIGVNRVGEDGNDISYVGSSRVLNPRGEVISSVEYNTEGLAYCRLDKDEMEDFKIKFPAWKDADDFSLSV